MAKYLIIGDGGNIPANKDKVEPLLKRAGYNTAEDFDSLVESVIEDGVPLHIDGDVFYLDQCLKFSKTEEHERLRRMAREARKERENDRAAYAKFVEMYRSGSLSVV